MMKTRCLIPLLAGLLCAGCASHYAVTLSNGTRLVVPEKPRLEGNCYVYKDASGREVALPVGRVREIAPASMGSSFYNSDATAAPSR
jgi:hypothetical protein